VIPVYTEEKNVEELHEKLIKVLSSLKKKYEIIFVDDGSTDNTFENLLRIHEKDEHVKVIKFRKNFGKATALSVGFNHANGDIVITMDGDLQDDPEEIPNFINKINEDYDLVVGWKFQRKDPITKTLPSKIFNTLTMHLTKVKIHDFNCGFKAYRKEVTENIEIYGELHRYIPALAYWKGYRIAEIKVKHHARKHGKSKYGGSRLVKGFLDLLTVKFLISFTKKPLHLFGTIGLLFLSFGFVIDLYLMILHILFLFGGPVEWEIRDRPLLLLGILLIVSGIQFISFGLIGEMIASKNQKEDEETIIKKKLG
jgi:glycosyltransferase involved in cell wall biosynthesis